MDAQTRREDFYVATNGDILLATREDFFMAMDKRCLRGGSGGVRVVVRRRSLSSQRRARR